MSVYDINKINELLENNTYPGRGIVIGTSADGLNNVIAYFIMGRSENSRNRVFKKEEDGISTEAYDPSKLKDPSLIIYHPLRVYEDKIVVTNGDQTDTIVEGLKNGVSFFESLKKREFEPDGPNWTPRISGIVSENGEYEMSILKSIDLEGSACARHLYTYPRINGLGHFIHTYNQDGNPIPTFNIEPERVEILNDMDEYTKLIWNSLNKDNKISLYVRYTNLKDGTYKETLLNKHLGD